MYWIGLPKKNIPIMNRIRTVIIISFFLISGLCHAQISLTGCVIAKEDNQPIEFSYITIHDVDSSKVGSALTDMKGEYEFPDMKPGSYFYSIESFGFKPLQGKIDIEQPSEGGSVIMNFYLETNILTLDGAVVSSSSVQKTSRKTDYILSSKDILNKNNGLEVIQTLPDLYFDVKEQKLKPLSGSNIKILINGASATEHDLRSLAPDQIKKIEYYDFPPARYSDYSRVMNVITRYLNTGYYLGAGAQHAFTTGFGNDDIYAKYNWGLNQLSLSWDLEHRKYSDSQDDELYDYIIDGKNVQRKSTGLLDFGYDANELDLTYIRNVENKYLFQTSFIQHILDYDSSGDYGIKYVEDGLSYRKQLNNTSRYDFQPSLDIYTQIFFENGNDLTLNAVETIFKAGNDNYNIETLDGATIFEDKSKQSNTKNSTIANVEYCFNRSWGSIALGTKYQYSFLKERIRNSFGKGNNKTTINDGEIYLQADGQIGKKFSYSVNAGASYYFQNNDLLSYNTWIFSPSLSLNYNLNDKYSLRLHYERSNGLPTLSQLSDSKIYITDYIIKEGNPKLSNSIHNSAAFNQTFHNKWLDLIISARLNYTERPINAFFTSAGDHLSLRYENGIYRKEFGGEVQGRISPFESRLFEFRFMTAISRTQVNSDYAGYYAYTNIPFVYIVDFNYKNFNMSYMGNIPGYNVSGPYLNSDEKISTLSAQYSWKNWTISASIIGLFSSVYYKSRLFNDNILKNESYRNILDNRNMFALGIRYYIQRGKGFNRGTKYLNNSDNDSGLFQ